MCEPLSGPSSRAAMVQDYDDGEGHVVDGTSRYATASAPSQHHDDADLAPECIPLPPSAGRGHDADMPPMHRQQMPQQSTLPIIIPNGPDPNFNPHAHPQQHPQQHPQPHRYPRNDRPGPAPPPAPARGADPPPPMVPDPPASRSKNSKGSKGKSESSHRRKPKRGDRPEYYGISSSPPASRQVESTKTVHKSSKTKLLTDMASSPPTGRRSRRPRTTWVQVESPNSSPTLPSPGERQFLPAPRGGRRNSFSQPPAQVLPQIHPRDGLQILHQDNSNLPATNGLRTSRAMFARNQEYPPPESQDSSDATSQSSEDHNPHGLIVMPPNPGHAPPPPPPDAYNPHGLVSLSPGNGMPPPPPPGHQNPGRHVQHAHVQHHPNNHPGRHPAQQRMGRPDMRPNPPANYANPSPHGVIDLSNNGPGPRSQPGPPHGFVGRNQGGPPDAPRPPPTNGGHGLIVLGGPEPAPRGRPAGPPEPKGWNDQGHGRPFPPDPNPVPNFRRLSIADDHGPEGRRFDDDFRPHGYPPAAPAQPQPRARPMEQDFRGQPMQVLQRRNTAPDPHHGPGPLPPQLSRQQATRQGYLRARPDEVEEASSADSSEHSDDAPVLPAGHPFLRMKEPARETILREFRKWQSQVVSRAGYRAPGRTAFVCPFALRDPMHWKGCFSDNLVEIRDVRRHLIRRHGIPFYCPRCMETFGDEQHRDHHIRTVGCRSRPWATPEGVTESQKRELEKRGPTNLSLRQQWFRIFDIVFDAPGHQVPLPESPLMDADLHQDISMLREFLDHHGPAILSDFLTFHGHATWSLPNEERDLAAFQRMMLEDGVRDLVDQWYSHPPGDCHEDESSFDSVNSVDQQRTPSAGSYAISDGQGGRWDRGGLGLRRGSAGAGQVRYGPEPGPGPGPGQRWDGPRIHDDGEWPMDGFARDGHQNAGFDLPIAKHMGSAGDGGLIRIYPGSGRVQRSNTTMC